MAGTRPPSLRAVILRSGQGVEEVIGGERQGLGALEELMHVSEGEIEVGHLQWDVLFGVMELSGGARPGTYHGPHPFRRRSMSSRRRNYRTCRSTWQPRSQTCCT